MGAFFVVDTRRGLGQGAHRDRAPGIGGYELNGNGFHKGMRAIQKLVASFEEDGFITDPSNANLRSSVHCRYDLWQEYAGDPPRPTFNRIVGVLEAKDPLALFRLCEQEKKLELRTELRSFKIYLVNSRGEFIASELANE